MQGTAETPATNYLFNTKPGSKKTQQRNRAVVPPSSSQTAMLEQINKTGHKHCQVKETETKDYRKLTRVMQFKRDTTKLTPFVEPDNNPKWQVDS